MTTLIIFGIIILAGFLFRKQLTQAIITLIKKNKHSNTIEHTGKSSVVFSPAGTVRTFVIALDIEEQGDGTVNITLAKKLTKKND